MIKVSIVIPFYNCSYIARAIESALNQSYEHCEVVVIDDGSDESYSQLAAPYFNTIKYIKKGNGGTASALNEGIRQMTGEYFAWLSSDDLFIATKVEKQIQFMIENDLPVTYTNYYLINENDEITSVPQGIYFDNEKVFLERISKGCFINGSTIMAKKDRLMLAGLFNESLKYTQDYDMWLKLLQSNKLGYISEPLFKYRVHQAMGSKQHNHNLEISSEIRKVQRWHRSWIMKKINEMN